MICTALVVDTNVLVSGLLTADSSAPTAWFLDRMLAASLPMPFILSEDLLDEYLAVLRRPRLRTLHGLSDEEIDTLLEEIAVNGILRMPVPSASRAPDPGDQHLFDLLAAQPGAVLVTGDRLLLDHPPPGASILSPRVLLDLLLGLDQP